MTRGIFRTLWMFLLGSFAAVVAHAQVTNAPAPSAPTLDGVGLASLAGALAVAGSWVIARHRANKD